MASILPISRQFDQPTMQHLMAADAVVQRYRTLFTLFDWSAIDPPRPPDNDQLIRVEAVKVDGGSSEQGDSLV